MHIKKEIGVKGENNQYCGGCDGIKTESHSMGFLHSCNFFNNADLHEEHDKNSFTYYSLLRCKACLRAGEADPPVKNYPKELISK